MCDQARVANQVSPVLKHKRLFASSAFRMSADHEWQTSLGLPPLPDVHIATSVPSESTSVESRELVSLVRDQSDTGSKFGNTMGLSLQPSLSQFHPAGDRISDGFTASMKAPCSDGVQFGWPSTRGKPEVAIACADSAPAASSPKTWATGCVNVWAEDLISAASSSDASESSPYVQDRGPAVSAGSWSPTAGGIKFTRYNPEQTRTHKLQLPPQSQLMLSSVHVGPRKST